MSNKIRTILDNVGYHDTPATEEGLTDCFLDYMDSGAFGNLEVDEAIQDIKDGDITIDQIIRNMSKFK